MALIKCPECGKEFSDKATACPNCGCPVEKIKSVPQAKENDQLIFKEKHTCNKKIVVFCIVLAIAATVVVIFATSNNRKYNQAIAYMEDENYQDAQEIFTELGTYKDSVDQKKKCEEAMVVDSQYLRDMAKGLMARWDQIDIDEANGDSEDVGKCYSSYCDIELKYIENYEDVKFRNSSLEADVKDYIELVRQAKDAAQFYTVDYTKYSYEWNEVYEKRVVLIKKFVNEYGLIVDNEHQADLDSIINDATAVESTPNSGLDGYSNRG